MHILLISPYWKEPHRWMVSSVKLAELWQRMGHRVTVVCMGHGEACELVSPTLTIHRVKDFFFKDPWNYGIACGFTGKVLGLQRELRPDVVVVNKILFWSSLAILRLRWRGVKVILLTDALVGMTWWPRTFLPRVGAAIYAWTLGWLLLLCAQRVVFFHPQPKNLLHLLGVYEKSRVIPTGIDVPSFRMHDDRLNYPLAASRSPLTITYLGRLESVKGVEDFCAAVLPLLGESVRAQIVGSFSEGHPLIAQYKTHITFTGLRDDIPAILGATDIFVLPSYSEGLSNALMEAMASGCACVASAVGGNGYLIQNGISGFLFPPGDIEALRSHLRRLIEDRAKRESLGREARKRIEAQCDWSIVGKMYEELFLESQRSTRIEHTAP